MAQIGTLVTGAGVTTVISGQSQCEEFLVIGGPDTANVLSGLQVEIDGVPFYNITGQQVLITAFAKFMQQFCNTVVALAYKVATGRIMRNTTYRLTNSGVTTPAIYATSDNQSGIPLVVASQTVLQSSYDDFNKFSALFLTVPANVSSLEFSFMDGTKSTMSIFEAATLFTFNNPSEASGYLGGVLVIDNRNQTIKNVRVNVGATAVSVMTVKLPDASFKALNQ